MLPNLRFPKNALLGALQDSFWQSGRFITPSAELSPDRPHMLFAMIRSVVLLLIASKAERFLSRTFQTLVFVFYGFRIFSVVFGFILSFTNFPVPGPPKSSKFVYVIRAFGFGLVVLAAVASLNAIFNRPNVSMSEYRVGALLFGIGAIISLLSTSQPKTPLLGTLVGIRRSLALGQLDLDTARRQTEIALQGMTVSDALQSQLVSLLADLERGGIHLEAASKEIEAFLNTFRSRGSEASKETHTLVHMLIQSVNRHQQEVKTAFDSFAAKRNKFNQRIFAYRRISPEIEGSVALLHRKLDDAFEVFNSKRSTLIQRASEFDGMLRSEQTQAGSNQIAR